MDWKKTERGPNIEDRRFVAKPAPKEPSLADRLHDLYERIRNEHYYETYSPDWWQYSRELDADRFGLEVDLPRDATEWDSFRQDALRRRS